MIDPGTPLCVCNAKYEPHFPEACPKTMNKSLEDRLETLEKEVKQLRQQVILLETQKQEIHYHHHYDYLPTYTPPIYFHPTQPTQPWQPSLPGTGDPNSTPGPTWCINTEPIF